MGLPLGLRNGENPFTCLGLGCLSRCTRLTRQQADRKCVIELQITGDLLIASWYKLWAAAVAVVGMCVRKGQDGVATVEGRSNLSVHVYWSVIEQSTGGIASLTISVSRQRGDDLSGTVTTA